MATSLDFSDLISSVSSVLTRLSEKKMAVYSGLGFLMDKDLPPPRDEYPVEENDKGLFAIIKNDDFKYTNIGWKMELFGRSQSRLEQDIRKITTFSSRHSILIHVTVM